MKIALEIFGYVGTAFVLLSMMMTSVVKLRILNTIGSVISMTYSILCGAWPVVFLNLGLIIINVYQLICLGRTKTAFSYVVAEADDRSLLYFLQHHASDIARYFPDFKHQPGGNTEVHLVYAEAELAGVLIGKREDTTLNVELDYAAVKYRDCSVATFLFSHLKEAGITRLVTLNSVNYHKQYLAKMGFESQDGMHVKTL